MCLTYGYLSFNMIFFNITIFLAPIALVGPLIPNPPSFGCFSMIYHATRDFYFSPTRGRNFMVIVILFLILVLTPLKLSLCTNFACNSVLATIFNRASMSTIFNILLPINLLLLIIFGIFSPLWLYFLLRHPCVFLFLHLLTFWSLRSRWLTPSFMTFLFILTIWLFFLNEIYMMLFFRTCKHTSLLPLCAFCLLLLLSNHLQAWVACHLFYQFDLLLVFSILVPLLFNENLFAPSYFSVWLSLILALLWEVMH